MGKMLLEVTCEKCGTPLLEFQEGKKAGEILIHSHGVVVGTEKLAQKIGIAHCQKCGAKTEFDAQYLPIPPGKLQ